MKKFIFPALFAFLFMFASCMNMSGSSGEGGSVRVVLPGSARYSFSQDKADKFVVTISLGSKLVDTKTGFSGGVIEFDELNPGDYTIEAKAFDSNEGDLVVGWGTAETTVNAGESTDCSLSLQPVVSAFDSAPSYKKLVVLSSADMVKLCELVNAGSDFEGITITLVDDVDLADYADDWQPIGFIKSTEDSDADSNNMPFRGTFNGNGKTISYEIKKREDGLASQVFGLFFDNYGTIENLVVNQTYSGDLSDRMLSRGGMICAYNYGNIKNCIVMSDIAIGTRSDTAGICKVNTESGKVVNCFVTGNIENQLDANWRGSYQKTGGICAINYGTVENVVSAVNIKTKSLIDNKERLNNIAAAIAARTDGYLSNCYWLKDSIDQDGNLKNHIAYVNNKIGECYTEENCIPDPSKITGCGYFDTNSPSASVTAGTTSECKSAQTLAYSGTLIQMLNAYVSASSDSGLKRWTAGADGSLALDF
ncbi:hypothetical protein [Treponema succinifaciens]|uniref:hypothetical protein n=1 Tax=Treponema succinifaciens TaxID=167 RepID=UPI003F819D4C